LFLDIGLGITEFRFIMHLIELFPIVLFISLSKCKPNNFLISGELDVDSFGLLSDSAMVKDNDEDEDEEDTDEPWAGILECVACEPPDCAHTYICHNAVMVHYEIEY